MDKKWARSIVTIHTLNLGTVWNISAPIISVLGESIKITFNRVRFQLCLSRRGKICIFKYGECKPSFSQRVKFSRKTVDEEGIYPVMGVRLRGNFFNYFREKEPFTLQRIAARRIIDCFVNENGQMEVHGHIPRPVENLLRKAFKKKQDILWHRAKRWVGSCFKNLIS